MTSRLDLVATLNAAREVLGWTRVSCAGLTRDGIARRLRAVLGRVERRIR